MQFLTCACHNRVTNPHIVNTMKTYDQAPEGLQPFDIDAHLPIVSAFIASGEKEFYNTNAMLGSQLKLADGVRLEFDIINVRSLLHADRSSVFISFGPSIAGRTTPINDSREIAGVLAGELWFKDNGRFFRAQDELDAKRAAMAAIAEPLKRILGPVFENLGQALEELRRPHEEGEEWKKDPPKE